MIVLIPAYEPDERLVKLVAALRDRSPSDAVLVVDDGSGPQYSPVFDDARRAGAEVIGSDRNRGKGAALKAGFAHVTRHHPSHDVVTADSDGQHAVDDILRVGDAVRRGDADLVLGTRLFVGDVPPRSRLGNAISRRAFALATGVHIRDTQTGLRGIPARMLPRLARVRGERFDYEQRVLLELSLESAVIQQVDIATIYLEQNTSSHFRPVRDSMSVLAPVLRPLVRFGAVSLASFALDATLLAMLFSVTGSLLVSVVGARVVSGTVNFAANRRLVFRGERGAQALFPALGRYIGLALALLVGGYALLAALTGLGIPLLAAKLVSETALYGASFVAQRSLVFARGRRSRHAQPMSTREINTVDVGRS